MTETARRLAPPSLTEHVAPLDAGAHVVGRRLGSAARPAFALGRRPASSLATPARTNARRRCIPDAGDPRRRPATASALVTGGDDGRVVAAAARDGATRVSIADEKGRWIDARRAAAQAGPSPGRAGKTRSRARRQGPRQDVGARPRRARGLAFAPKGYRLAVSHYNGATLWFPNAEAQARVPRMEGLASRRHLVAGRALRRHLDAGERAARLAARRQGGTCA